MKTLAILLLLATVAPAMAASQHGRKPAHTLPRATGDYTPYTATEKNIVDQARAIAFRENIPNSGDDMAATSSMEQFRALRAFHRRQAEGQIETYFRVLRKLWEHR